MGCDGFTLWFDQSVILLNPNGNHCTSVDIWMKTPYTWRDAIRSIIRATLQMNKFLKTCTDVLCYTNQGHRRAKHSHKGVRVSSKSRVANTACRVSGRIPLTSGWPLSRAAFQSEHHQSSWACSTTRRPSLMTARLTRRIVQGNVDEFHHLRRWRGCSGEEEH